MTYDKMAGKMADELSLPHHISQGLKTQDLENHNPVSTRERGGRQKERESDINYLLTYLLTYLFI